MMRVPRCLDNRLIDDGKAVSPMHRTLLPRNIIFFLMVPVLILSKPQDLVWLEGLGKFKISPHQDLNQQPSSCGNKIGIIDKILFSTVLLRLKIFSDKLDNFSSLLIKDCVWH
jgi:hypothetical protein